MSKPILYVSLHGPILVPSVDDQDPFLQRKIVDHAKTFMHWARTVFDVRWFADNDAREAFYVSRRLLLPDDAVPVHSHTGNRAEAVDPRSNFYWVDDYLTPGEHDTLMKHNLMSRVIWVDPLVGVTPAHQRELQSKLGRS